MKKFIKKLACIVFSISIIALSLSMTIENAIIETITLGFTKSDITEKLIDGFTDSFADLDSLELRRIKSAISESKEIDEISSLFLETIINDVKNDSISKIDITKQINSILSANLEKVPKIYHTEITNRVNSIDYNRIYTNIISQAKERSNDNILTTIDIYNLIVNIKFRLILIFSCLFSIIIVILFSKPQIESLHDFGIILSISGGIMIVALVTLRQLSSYLVATTFGIPISLSFTMLTMVSFGSLVTGIIMLDIYERITDKDIKKTNAKKLRLLRK